MDDDQLRLVQPQLAATPRRLRDVCRASQVHLLSLERLTHSGEPTGKRPVGRQKQRWMDNIEKDLKRASLSLHGILPQGETELELVGDRER